MLRAFLYVLVVMGLCFSSALQSVGAEWKGESAPELKPSEEDEAYQKIELLTEILMQIKRNYVDEKQYGEIVDGAIHGMLQSMDPHSDYLDPDAYEDMREDTQGRYGGVGIHIGIRSHILTVIAPIEDTPAFEAGLLPGDRIVKIDGLKTRKMDLSDALEKIRGERGTTVVLTVAREGEADTLDFEVRRDNIKVSSVKGARIIRDKVGYIRVTQFSARTAQDFQEAFEELLKEEDMQGLVLDLRNNPGGLVRSAVNLAQKFLKKGELIVTTKGRRYHEGVQEKKAEGDVRYLDIPLVILVNEGSASAAEIVAGALQDHGRAVLLGETTYGKGSVQSILPLRSESQSAIRLTTARYYTPSGKVIHDHGIEPDILLHVTPSEWIKVQRRRAILENEDLYTEEERAKYADVRDSQLEKAVELVESKMILDGVVAEADAEE